MPTGSEYVRSSGQTGSDRRTVKTALLTLTRHSAIAYWLDADEHHLGLALRTGGALDRNEWNGRQAGATLSVTCVYRNLSRLKSPQQRSDQAEKPVNSEQDCCSYAIEADL